MNFVDLTGEDNNAAQAQDGRVENAVANVLVQRQQAGGTALVRVEVFGPPRSLPRSRHWRNGFWNPANQELTGFRLQVLGQNPVLNYGIPFGRGVAVTVVIKFYLRVY